MSPTRRLLRALSFAALACALLLLWFDRRPAATRAVAITPPLHQRAVPTAPARPPQTQPSGAVVTLEVVDTDGAPAAGAVISLNGASGTTDETGRLTLTGVQPGIAIFSAAAPWLVTTLGTSGAVAGPLQQRRVVVERGCGGSLQIAEEDGAPIEGARIVAWAGQRSRSGQLQVPLLSDGLGQIPMSRRPCGALQVTLRLPGGETIPELLAFVEGEQPAALLVPPPREGILQVLGEDGAPLEASLQESDLLSHMAPLGTGRFSLTSRRPRVPVLLRGDFPPQRVSVPLAGGVFEHTVAAPREVAVTLRCTECPEQLTCGGAPCERLDERTHRCSCPPSDAMVAQLEEGGARLPLGEVYADEAAAEFSLLGDVALRGRWTGALPCEVRVRYDRGQAYSGARACDGAGRFEFLGLRAGDVTVHIQGAGEEASHALTLVGGEDVDMGALWPESRAVAGEIDADFSLWGARLSSYPHGAVVLEPDGRFGISGLPARTASLELRLESAGYGVFREVFEVGEGDIWWEISWLPEESRLEGDSGEVGDSGGGEDSGGGWLDTGWSEIGDSGW